MKVLHLSYHVGLINDLNYTFTTLGHDITFKHLSFPNFCVTDEIANQFWSQNEAEIQACDIILTSDTVSLAYIFMRHIDELKPHLVVYNSNRFDYAMWDNPRFYELMRKVPDYLHKVTMIPCTDFEKQWCGRHGVHVSEPIISSLGKALTDKVYTSERVTNDFGGQRINFKTADNADTMFVQTYLNHGHFMNLPQFLNDNRISTVWGGYSQVEEIQPFKGTIVFPDAFSKVFVFESIQRGVIVFVPTKRFLLELAQKPNYWFNITGFMGNTNQLVADNINLCEWYKYPETRVYFDSLEDMIVKIRDLTPAQIADKKEWMKFYGEQIERTVLTGWRNALDKVELYRNQTSR